MIGPVIRNADELHGLIHQKSYQASRNNVATFLKKAWKASLNNAELTEMESLRNDLDVYKGLGGLNGKGHQQVGPREKYAKSMISKMAGQMYKAGGVTTATGFNFYDLRGPVALLYPVNTPFRNSLPRIGRVNDGYGTAAHWMATRNPGYPYAGVPEGQRAAIGTPDNNQYVAAYKEIGDERAATFTSEFAGEGFADNVADEHLRGMHSLFLQEEGIMLLGNSGTAFNGYALGTPGTPTGAVAATHTSPGTVGNIGTPGNADLPYTTILTTSNYVSVAVVALTGMGNPANVQYGYNGAPTISGGLTPTFTRTSAIGELVALNGGMSAISVISTPVQATSGNLTIQFKIPAAGLPMKGAYAYAWFVDVETSNTGSLAGAKLAGITTTPYCFVTGTPTGTQTGAAVGLNSDHSSQSLDFDGLLTYTASTAGSYWSDLSANVAIGTATNNSLTSGKDGTVVEVEAALNYLFSQYQTGVDKIWGSPDAVLSLQKAIRYSGTAATGYMFVTTRDSQNNLLGGYVVSAYQSKFAVNSPLGGNQIPIVMHPMLPPGTLYFEISTNPYPHSRAPYVRGMLVQRDYYSIEWPLLTRQWTFGTYVHEVLQHYMPWMSGVITGIGPFVGN